LKEPTVANVYTCGTFDLFHPGHIAFLKRCSRLAGPDGTLTVGLNTDQFVMSYKQRLPVMQFDERWSMLKECRYVTKIMRNIGGADLRPSISSCRPGIDIIAVGSDWACKDYFSQTGLTDCWLESNNIILVYLPYTAGISTSQLRERILANEGRLV
jgi:glycerol-3-phosphate cytidylyltransferase